MRFVAKRIAMKTVKTCWWLWKVNVLVSAFTFGGGYVVIPMLRKHFVQARALLTEDELMDMAAVAQSSPGAIAVNLAALAGYRVAGAAGFVVSAAAAVTPALVILAAVSAAYAFFRDSAGVAAALKGMEAGVAALMLDLVVDMYAAVRGRKRRMYSLLVPAAFLLAAVGGVNVGVILAGTAVVGIANAALAREGGT